MEEAFAAYYAAMPDEELLRVAANRQSLVPVELCLPLNLQQGKRRASMFRHQ